VCSIARLASKRRRRLWRVVVREDLAMAAHLADRDVIVQLCVSRRALAILTAVLLEAEMNFEMEGRQNFADLMGGVLGQLPKDEPTVH
jgi:hypothetical protein